MSESQKQLLTDMMDMYKLRMLAKQIIQES